MKGQGQRLVRERKDRAVGQEVGGHGKAGGKGVQGFLLSSGSWGGDAQPRPGVSPCVQSTVWAGGQQGFRKLMGNASY